MSSGVVSPNGPKKDAGRVDVELAVAQRYSAASQQTEAALCCPITYEPQFLEVLPKEILERDYGCGDPSRHIAEGETVLDLGCGGGKICYVASQIVGPKGIVIGVDMNDDMLSLARRWQQEVGRRIGWHNVEFRKGRIQDLALDLDRFDAWLRQQPVASASDWLQAQRQADSLRREAPMVASDSVDVVVSNCVLNLVKPEDRRQLFSEMFRVLRRGGRAIISDITCDEPAPERLKQDPKLWSGCLSGAFVEHEFLDAFEQAGFYGVEILDRQEAPWAVLEGIEFRSMTVRAYKGKEGPCMEHRQAVIYKGPFRRVSDDDGHVLRRGVRTAVCEKTYHLYTQAPYAEHFLPVPPNEPVRPEDAEPMDCHRAAVRHPSETKGQIVQDKPPGDSCCDPGNCC